MSRHSIPKRFFGSVFCYLLCVASVASAATVRLKDRTTVTDTIIRLGDVADITEFDAKARKSLEDIELGPAPATGIEVRLDYAAIKSRLKSLGVDLSRIDFSGRSIVRVTRAGKTSAVKLTTFNTQRRVVVPTGQQLRAEKLITNVITQLLKRRSSDVGGLNVRVQVRPEDVAGVLSAARREFSIQGLQTPKPGVQQVTVAFLDRHEQIHKVVVACRFSSKPYVWAARYPLRRGLIIQVGDLFQKQVDDLKNGFTEVEQVVGREVVRPISRDAVINSTDIRREIVVKSNQIIKVTSQHGRIVVGREMKARQSGAIGDEILCVERNGRGEVRARVTGRNRAEVVSASHSRLAVLRDHSGSIEFRKPSKSETKTVTPNRSAQRISSGQNEPEWRSLENSASTRGTTRTLQRRTEVRPASSTGLSPRRQVVTPPIPRR